MLQHDKMHRVVLSALAVILVASFLLALAITAVPTSVSAADGGAEPQSCWYEYRTVRDLCNSCGLGKAIYTRQRRLCCVWGVLRMG